MRKKINLIILGIILITLITIVSAYPSGLVSYWKVDGNTSINISDSAFPNRFNLTINHNSSFNYSIAINTTICRKGNCLTNYESNVDNNHASANTINLTETNVISNERYPNLTLTFFFYIHNITKGNASLLGERRGSSGFQYWQVLVNNNGSFTTNIMNDVTFSNSTININQSSLHFFAMTWYTGEINYTDFYIDGDKVLSINKYHGPTNGTVDDAGASDYFISSPYRFAGIDQSNVSIDEIHIFNRSLNTSELNEVRTGLVTTPIISYATNTENDGSLINRNNLFVNITTFDTYFANTTIYLFNASFSILNTSIFTNIQGSFINFTSLIDGLYYFNATSTNTNGDNNTIAIRNVTIETVNPLITFTSPTDTNNSYVTRNYILANITFNDTNLANATIYLFNASYTQINSSNATTSPLYANFSGLVDGTYYLNATATDTFNNRNSTLNRQIIVDVAGPTLAFVSPDNNSVQGTANTNFTCNVSSITPLKNMTFSLWNSLNTLITSPTVNISGTFNNTNFSYNFIFSDTYHWGCWAYNNDSIISNIPSNRTLIVDLTNPAINLLKPTNNQWINNATNTQFNCSVTDNNPDSVFLYSNFSGTYGLNQTLGGVVSGATNTFRANLSEASYLWSCSANKTTSSTRTAGQQGNFTVNIDLTYPIVNVSAVNVVTGSQTVTIVSSVSDAHVSTCKYSVYNLSGSVDGLNNNVSLTCNSNVAAVVSAFGTYNATVYSTDLAGNENSSTRQFTTIASSSSSGGGGGGGAELTKIPVIGLQQIQGDKNYTDLQREIIYATINNLCADKLGPSDTNKYSQNCVLSVADTTVISDRLATHEVAVTNRDIILFIQGYRDNKVTQGAESQDTIIKYSLVSSVLGLLTSLQIYPASSIDTPIVINVIGGKNYTITSTLISNKPLRSCDIVSGGDSLGCSILNTTIKISYNIKNTSFFNEIFTGTVNVVTDTTQDKLEQKRIPITFRVYNTGYTAFGFVPIYAFVIISVLILIMISIIIYRRFTTKRKMTLFEQLKNLTPT